MSRTAGPSDQSGVQVTSKHHPGSKGHSPSREVAKCSLVRAPRGSPSLGNACPSWLGSPCTQRGWGPLSRMTESRRVGGNTCSPFLPEGQAGPACRFSRQRERGSAWGPVQRLRAVQRGSRLPPSAHASPAPAWEPGGCGCTAVGWEGADSKWERHRGAASHVDDPWGSREAQVTAHRLLPSQPFPKGEG